MHETDKPNKRTLEELTSFVETSISQGHICILNDGLFEKCVREGIYGFPHGGRIGTKSFWRSLASLYNIGPRDLMFFHRTSGPHEGCKEIHGPFRIETRNEEPCIFYDSTDEYPITFDGTECTARLLFKPVKPEYYSIRDNYELIKRFEMKRIWGLRHPSVMNIGAAQKKSISSITVKQTLELIDLLYSESYGTKRGELDMGDTSCERVLTYYRDHTENVSGDKSFRLDDHYLENIVSNSVESVPDEAVLYCYILRGLRFPNSKLRSELLMDIEATNEKLFKENGLPTGEVFAGNTILELVPSPHLQETIDIMLCDKAENTILLMEIKKDSITQEAVEQCAKYIDLFQGIFPKKRILADIIGSRHDPGLKIPEKFHNQIKTIEYRILGNRIRFAN